MKDILSFRKMITPVVLQILFWPAVAASVYYSTWLIIQGHIIGWVPLIIGTLLVRVVFELTLIRFRQYDKLCEIANLVKDSRGLHL